MTDYRKIIEAAAKKETNPAKVVVFDFDGTIAEAEKYPIIGKPITKTIQKMRDLSKKGYTIIISSCRFSDLSYTTKQLHHEIDEVKKWLKENDVPYDEIWKHDKPMAAVYVDDRAVNVNELDKIEDQIKKF